MSSCVNQKMMEITYQELDTLKVQQQVLIDRLDELTRLYESEREERLRTQADAAATLQELRAAVDALGYRIDDASQRGGYPSQSFTPVPVPTPAATAQNDSLNPWAADTLPPGPIQPGDSEAEKLFKGSYMDLTLGNYDLAVQGFKNYLVRFPNASNLPNAHFYLGDSYYSLNRYLEAVAEFQNVIREFPGSRFAPASYLKSAYCYQRLDETQLAERHFRELMAKYPRSEEAEQARVALSDMGG